MKHKQLALIGTIAVLLIALTSVAVASSGNMERTATLRDAVRQATAQFKDVEAAKAAGYGVFHGCSNGPQEGSMGIHFANPELVDGEVDAQRPEALLYEPKNGKLQLLGVEYVIPAEAWHVNHEAPPVLMGQLFNYVGAPNRYGLPAFYELHVWAWKNNPNGTFSDWNPRVSCDEFSGMPANHEATH